MTGLNLQRNNIEAEGEQYLNEIRGREPYLHVYW